jgi:acetyl esterase/lipase
MRRLLDISASLDPELSSVFASFPEIEDAADNWEGARAKLLERRRRFGDRADTSGLRTVNQRDVTVAAISTADPAVKLRVYSMGVVTESPDPAILWLHGGGFTMGTVDMDDEMCRRIVLNARAVVVSVDYGLAPERPFPAAINDAYAALRWMSSASSQANIDRLRIAVAGQSAGAGIAAGLSLMARDRKELHIAYQVLLYACLDDRLRTPSSREILDPRSWNRKIAAGAWQAYLGQAGGDVTGYAAPARAADLSGLPPTYVMVGGFDMVRDENLEYASRLMRSHVPTELHVYPGAFHGFELLVPDATVSQKATADWQGALRRVLHP